MEMRADDRDLARDTPERQSGSAGSRNGRPAGPTTREGAQYLEELRALRRAQPPGGLRIFNPDETPEEAAVRIREVLDGLAALNDDRSEDAEEEGKIWDEVMEAVAKSRSGGGEHDSEALDS
jgi:hypothetical protein